MLTTHARRQGGFQSHAGSIEAESPQPPVSVKMSHFNPTLVRLRPAIAGQCRPSSPNFNPTLVRLRPNAFQRAVIPILLFQSHAGSIEAWSGRLSSYLKLWCFNPTLVRLRQPVARSP